MVWQPKIKILTGLMFVITAFIGAAGLVYLQVRHVRQNSAEMKAMQGELDVLKTEKSVADLKIADLNDKVGASLNLDLVVAEAQKVYDRKEQDRKEGFLWVDRSSGNIVVTLGALNGLSVGSRLRVYEGKKKGGLVTVEKPMDVISYVAPVNMTLADFKRNYYRVVLER